MERSNLDALLIFGNAADYGDLVYVSNFHSVRKSRDCGFKNKEILRP